MTIDKQSHAGLLVTTTSPRVTNAVAFNMDQDDVDADFNAAPEDALLPQSSNILDQTEMTRLGTFRAVWLGCIVCIGGFLV